MVGELGLLVSGVSSLIVSSFTVTLSDDATPSSPGPLTPSVTLKLLAEVFLERDWLNFFKRLAMMSSAWQADFSPAKTCSGTLPSSVSCWGEKDSEQQAYKTEQAKKKKKEKGWILTGAELSFSGETDFKLVLSDVSSLTLLAEIFLESGWLSLFKWSAMASSARPAVFSSAVVCSGTLPSSVSCWTVNSKEGFKN